MLQVGGGVRKKNCGRDSDNRENKIVHGYEGQSNDRREELAG